MSVISFGSVSISDFSFISITSVSSYLWIAFWIAFCFIFIWIRICRIVDCWLNRQSFKLFYRFCPNVWRNLPLIWNVFNISLYIGRDGVLTEGIHSHIIGVMFGIKFFLFRFCHDFTDRLTKLLTRQWYIVTIIMVNYSFHQSHIVFFFGGGHARFFIFHFKSVKNILTTFEYVKIAWHFICHWRFLILCLIICIFFFVNISVNSLWFVFLRRKFVDDDEFLFVLVHRTDLR